jgi:trigger factor
MQGMNLETYMKYTGATMEEFSKTFRPQAEKQVKMRLALEAIVKKEGFTVTDAEVDEQYAQMAKDYSTDVEQIKAAVPAEELKKDIAVQKALELVKTSAVVEEPEAKTAEKKPAAKKTSEKTADVQKPAAKKTTTKKAAEKKSEE